MFVSRIYWAASVAIGGAGAALTAAVFDSSREWFYVGLVMVLASGTGINTGCIMRRSRTLDAEFEAGYRVGHRAGRRVGAPTVIHLDDRRRDGRLSQAPLREVAGVDTAARRDAAHAD